MITGLSIVLWAMKTFFARGKVASPLIGFTMSVDNRVVQGGIFRVTGESKNITITHLDHTAVLVGITAVFANVHAG